jgi:hypothetical protein
MVLGVGRARPVDGWVFAEATDLAQFTFHSGGLMLLSWLFDSKCFELFRGSNEG